MARMSIMDYEDMFVHAASERKLRPEEVNGEFAWITYERKVMMDAVNAERVAADLAPVTEEEFKRQAENQAMGHCDYAHKLALYCWMLANEADRVPLGKIQ